MDSSTSASEITENLLPLAFASSFVFFKICICVQHFFDAVVRNQTSNWKYLLEIQRQSKERSKVHQDTMSSVNFD